MCVCVLVKTSGFVLFGIVVFQLDQSTHLTIAFSAGAEEERCSGRKAPGVYVFKLWYGYPSGMY